MEYVRVGDAVLHPDWATAGPGIRPAPPDGTGTPGIDPAISSGTSAVASGVSAGGAAADESVSKGTGTYPVVLSALKNKTTPQVLRGGAIPAGMVNKKERLRLEPNDQAVVVDPAFLTLEYGVGEIILVHMDDCPNPECWSEVFQLLIHQDRRKNNTIHAQFFA